MRTLIERFELLADFGGEEDACVQWLSVLTPKGYGRFHPNRQAHRVSYELFVGPIPAGMTIDHSCRNTGCVNPQHLRTATWKENSGWHRDITHCPAGHEYTPANTYHAKDGSRNCRACGRAAQRRYQERRRGE